jgi:hypothetical protein
MEKSSNPYPKSIIDECSGIQVSSIAHKIWADGYQAGRRDERAGRKRVSHAKRKKLM